MSFKRSRIACFTSLSGFRASTSPDTSKHFAKISRLIGPRMWPKPKSSYTRLLKHAGVRESRSFKLTTIASP